MKAMAIIFSRERIYILMQLALAQLIILLASLYSIRAYTELLNPSSFGYAMMGIGLILLFDGVTGMPLSQTILSNCADINDADSRRRLSLRLSKALAMRLAIALSAASIVLYIAYLANIVSPTLPICAISLLFYSLFDIAKQSLFSLLIINKSYSKTTFWTAGETVVTLLVTLAILTLIRADATGLIAGYIIGRMISTALFITLYSGLYHFKQLRSNADKNEIEAAFRFGLPVALMGPLGWIAAYLDRYILAALLGPGATGSYVAASGLVSKPYSMLTAVLSNYFRPHLYQFGLTRQRRRTIIAQWAISALTLGALGFFAFLSIGPLIARLLLAPDFRADAPAIMAVLAAAQTMSIATHSADNALLSSGKSSSLLRLQTVVSFSTLILVPAGIVCGSLIGGLFGRLLAEIFKFSATIYFALRLPAGSEDPEI